MAAYAAFYFLRIIMIHVFKLGGKWKSSCGVDYTCKAIRENEKSLHLSDGWCLSLSDAKAALKVDTKKPNKTKAVSKPKKETEKNK